MIVQRVETVDVELVEAFRRLIPQLSPNHTPPSLADLQALVAFPGSVLLVARADPGGGIVGSATLSILRTPMGVHARLEDVIVDQDLRGQGIGATLTAQVLRLAREAGADYVALSSNPKREAANRLYQKMGFKKWETNVYRFELDRAV